MTIEKRKPLEVLRDCLLVHELKIISFKCRICMQKCELGEEIIRAIDKIELDEFHREMDEQFPDG
jgi:hypothetical protein